MQNLAELERRISSALDRIARAAGAAAAADPARTQEMHQLTEALEEERMVNAQLAERIKVMKAREDTIKAETLHLTERLKEALDVREAECQALREALAQARTALDDLRSGIDGGADLAGRLDQAILAENTALKAQRRADAADITAILTELEPIVLEATNRA